MDGLFRRGGVWYARLVVPQSLRLVIGKTELVASTGVREPALARVVASELLAGWRRRFLDLSRTLGGPMDIEQITLGHPALSGGGYLALAEAAKTSGIDEPYFLRQAADGKLNLYFRCAAVPGHLCSIDEFDREIGPDGVTLIVPSPAQMPLDAVQTEFSGVLRLRDARACAEKFTSGASQDCVLFDLPDQPDRHFAPLSPMIFCSSKLELAAADVDRIRKAWALNVTSAQVEAFRASKTAISTQAHPKANQRLSEIVEAYVPMRTMNCSTDQARRIRAALDLLVELEGDPAIGTLCWL